jgi:MFS family permease
MATSVNAGARLDRLPISSFHKRIFFLIGAGMFFDGYDLYVGTNVLGAVVQSKFATLEQVPQFISLTFLGLTIGSFVTGFIGDRYGRRFTYQFNLMIFGLASLAAAFAPDMMTLNILRFVMGLGLGAEIVVGYSTMTEFVPPRTRGRWLAFMSFIVVFGLPATALLGYLIIPNYGWRPMFVICGLGSLVVWYLRKSLPESPRWLETQGRTAEAEALMQAIEKEAATAAPLPPPQPATQRRPRSAGDRRLLLPRGAQRREPGRARPRTAGPFTRLLPRFVRRCAVAMGAHCLNSRTPLSDPPRREDITVLCVLGSPILNANRKVILKPKELDGVVAVNVDELLGHVLLALSKQS